MQINDLEYLKKTKMFVTNRREMGEERGGEAIYKANGITLMNYVFFTFFDWTRPAWRMG